MNKPKYLYTWVFHSTISGYEQHYILMHIIENICTIVQSLLNGKLKQKSLKLTLITSIRRISIKDLVIKVHIVSPQK